MDTVTVIRSVLQSLLGAPNAGLEVEPRAVPAGDDASATKPEIDRDEEVGREAPVDACAKDAFVCPALLDGSELDGRFRQAAMLAPAGQDLKERDDGRFCITHPIAPHRMVSTAESDAQHGHKTAAPGAGGYKGDAAVDPDGGLVTAAKAMPDNADDASVPEQLLPDVLADEPAAGIATREAATAATTAGDLPGRTTAPRSMGIGPTAPASYSPPSSATTSNRAARPSDPMPLGRGLRKPASTSPSPTPPVGPGTVGIRQSRHGGTACFGEVRAACPPGSLVQFRCWWSTIRVGRTRMRSPGSAGARTDPVIHRSSRHPAKIERKLTYLVHRRHIGRRARIRGTAKVDADLQLLASAANLALLAIGLHSTTTEWMATAT